MKRLMLFFVLCTTLFCFSCKPINGPEGGQGDTSGDTINNAAHPTDTLFNYCANDSVLNLIFDRGNYKFMGMDYEQNHFYVIQSQEELDALCPEWVESPSIDFDTYCIVYASIITPSISDKCSFISLTDTSLGVFAKNKSMMNFKFFIEWYNINTETAIDIRASIIVISVNFIIIAPINTTTHPNTSSSICRFTDF